MERKTIPAEGSAPRKKRKAVTANRKRHSDVVTSNRKDQAEV